MTDATITSPLSLAHFAVLETAKHEKILHSTAPGECEHLAELGLIKATLGGYRITSSGRERLARGQ